ncbi:bifunctional adenosylcobinamide kinase/adenosylcobinamide-phosphate guanylyltransferase [Tranquillimonas rosea]|uniref:bifunctional adenosylcobinamide kinase/adenosylcobinamide-phosphate guanylyltransferase n=1 Tax=Tranquillimonas rosea TaxID=641238 RepID=UPI003BADB5F0
MLSKVTLVLGGASSGKSDIAEKFVLKSGLPRVYVATAQAFDDEMRAKIKRHRAARGEAWTTLEAPFDAAGAISGRDSGEIVLLDCATLWLSNVLLADRDVDAEGARLVSALADAPCPVVVVSNEVGQGIVPENALSRRFRAAQGQLNRSLAAEAGTVIGVMAGLPFALKGTLPEGLA